MFKTLKFQINPIIVKDLRSRMRGPRAFVTLTIMLVLLAGITYIAYRITRESLSYYTGAPISPQIGQSLFNTLVFVLLFIICVITPAVTSGAISTEKERLTYEMLLATPLHPSRILWGKLFSAISYVFLLLFAAIPIASLIYVFGGVTLWQMIKALIILLATAIMLGILSMFLSASMRRTLRATVVSYLIVLFLILGTLLIYGIVGIFLRDNPPRWILSINPLSALASAISNINSSYSPMGLVSFLGADLSTLRGDTFPLSYVPRPLYHYTLPIYAFSSTVFYFITTRLVRPTRRWKITRKDILLFLSAILIILAIVFVGFFATTKNYERVESFQTMLFPEDGSMMKPMPVEVFVEEAEEAISLDPDFEPVPVELSVTDQSEILVLVIKDLTDSYISTSESNQPTIYLSIGVLDSERSDIPLYTLPEPLQVSISNALKDEPYDFLWVSSLQDAFKAADSDNHAAITFGEITSFDGETAANISSLHANGELLIETFYDFALLDSEWLLMYSEKVDG